MGEVTAQPVRAGRVTRAETFTVVGVVQGVGFRPHVHRVASSLGLGGWVANERGHVRVHVEGQEADIERFAERLVLEAPSSSSIASVERASAAVETRDGLPEVFRIVASEAGHDPDRDLAIGPDLATCPDCLAELLDPANPRHRYPFINCTACGPRYTIVEGLPYDRERTSMRGFELCASCSAEFEDPSDRRFHAQPNACPECGPSLSWCGPDGGVLAMKDDALVAASEALRAGKIVAVQGIGGFHLMVRADDAQAVARLRERKQRGDRPFAVLFTDADDVRARLGADLVSDQELELLASPAAPIVLIRAEQAAGVVPEVAPASPDLGCFVASNPIHHLLLRDVGAPLVATSGNRRSEPLATEAAEAFERLAGIADAFLTHDRPIVRPVDDSIVRAIDGEPLVLRRARGFAPLAIDWDALPSGGVDLALGPHMKNTVAIRSGRRVVFSPHIGDLDTPLARDHHERSTDDLQELVQAEPERFVCDLHPDYASTQAAERRTNSPVRVQHHVAHAWAAALDHGLDGPFLALTWDGTGFGEDGTVWGGEAFARDGDGLQRVASFEPFPLPGGERAVREPWRVAVGLIEAAFGKDAPEALLREPRRYADAVQPNAFALTRQIARGNAPLTSSVGRLFDAVAAILGLTGHNTFEAEAPQRLEWLATQHGDAAPYPVELNDAAPARLTARPWLSALAEDLDRGTPHAEIAARFHATLAQAAVLIARRSGHSQVALTGGCFQNRLLLERTLHALRSDGRQPLPPRRVPPGDGGVAAGQLVAAALGATRTSAQA